MITRRLFSAMPSSLVTRPLPSGRARVSDTRLEVAVSVTPLLPDDAEGGVVVLSEAAGYDLHYRNTVRTRAVTWLKDGSGRTFGCGTVTTPAGDQLHYSFEGWVSARPGTLVSTTEGSWRLTGGTGPWQRRTGQGVFRTTGSNLGIRVSDWEGSWE